MKQHGKCTTIRLPSYVFGYAESFEIDEYRDPPRAETSFARSRSIPRVDDLDVWSVWCIRVRPGYRGRGVSHPLLAGAVEYARSQGAPAIEGYPLDNRGEKINPTMAYVGTRGLFEKVGFRKAADTSSVLSGIPRVLMRLDLP